VSKKTIWGDNGNNTLYGTNGNDIIYGLDGDDVIYGGDGSDVIYAGNGNDFIIGGFGIDTIYGGDGNDTISWDNWLKGLSVDLASQRVYFNGDGGSEYFYSIENVVGSRGNDRMYGDYLNNVLSGNAGDDQIYGRDGNDTLKGDAGSDQLFGGNGSDTLDGGLGNDLIYGESENDSIVGSVGNDAIDGGNGTDMLNYSALAEAVTLKVDGTIAKGGAGQDVTYNVESFIGASGKANVIDATGTAAVEINLEAESLKVKATSGVSDRFYSIKNFVNAIGSQLSDIISGNSGNNNIDGGDGKDFLFGNGGNDQLAGGAGNDDIFGGEGDDVLVGGEGDDFMVGGGGNDTLTSLQATDYLSGTDEAHAGANERDILIGGLENDRFVLGDAQQAYYVANGTEDFAGILDFQAQVDVIVLHGAAESYTLLADGQNTSISYNGDRIAILQNTTGLTLNSSNFEFV
jgi:Ca2+-binding RTX toxin-like protein